MAPWYRDPTYSPWFPATVPAERRGTYQVLLEAGGVRCFAHWNGSAWSANWADHGAIESHAEDLATVTHWRGLTERAARRGRIRVSVGRLRGHIGP